MTATQAMKAARHLRDFASRLHGGAYASELQRECRMLARVLERFAKEQSDPRPLLRGPQPTPPPMPDPYPGPSPRPPSRA